MSEQKTQKVKLAADCYVDGVLRKKDDVVELTEHIAKDFGAIQTDEKPPVNTQQNNQTQK